MLMRFAQVAGLVSSVASHSNGTTYFVQPDCKNAEACEDELSDARLPTVCAGVELTNLPSRVRLSDLADFSSYTVEEGQVTSARAVGWYAHLPPPYAPLCTGVTVSAVAAAILMGGSAAMSASNCISSFTRGASAPPQRLRAVGV